MCFLAFVCHSAQWRAAVIGIGNALASLSLILLTLGYKVGKTIFLFGIISTLDDKQWQTCTLFSLNKWHTTSCQVAKLLLDYLEDVALGDPLDGHVVDAEHALAQKQPEEAAHVRHEAVAVVHHVLLPEKNEFKVPAKN